MPKFKNDCTFAEHARYVNAYLAIWDAINSTIMSINVWLENSNNTNAGERIERAREKRYLLAERELLEAKRQAYKANKSSINPPSKKKVEKALKWADEIDELLKNADAVDTALNLAVKSVKLYNTIQDV